MALGGVDRPIPGAVDVDVTTPEPAPSMESAPQAL